MHKWAIVATTLMILAFVVFSIIFFNKTTNRFEHVYDTPIEQQDQAHRAVSRSRTPRPAEDTSEREEDAPAARVATIRYTTRITEQTDTFIKIKRTNKIKSDYEKIKTQTIDNQIYAEAIIIDNHTHTATLINSDGDEIVAEKNIDFRPTDPQNDFIFNDLMDDSKLTVKMSLTDNQSISRDIGPEIIYNRRVIQTKIVWIDRAKRLAIIARPTNLSDKDFFLRAEDPFLGLTTKSVGPKDRLVELTFHTPVTCECTVATTSGRAVPAGMSIQAIRETDQTIHLERQGQNSWTTKMQPGSYRFKATTMTHPYGLQIEPAGFIKVSDKNRSIRIKIQDNKTRNITLRHNKTDTPRQVELHGPVGKNSRYWSGKSTEDGRTLFQGLPDGRYVAFEASGLDLLGDSMLIEVEGEDIEIEFAPRSLKGWRIIHPEDAATSTKLRGGDEIIGMNSERFESTEDVGKWLAFTAAATLGGKANELVTVTYRRDGNIRTATGTLLELIPRDATGMPLYE